MARKRKIPPELLTSPSPLINEFADYLNNSVRRYVPQFSLQSTFALFSHFYARKYTGSTGVSSGIYSLLVGESGVGKGYPKKAFSSMTTMHMNITSSATSEAGLRSEMVKNPCVFSIIDEIGDKLSSTNDNNKEYLAALREIYSEKLWLAKSYSQMYRGKIQKSTEDYSINHPCLSVLGMTTPQQLSDGLSEQDIESGTVNRFFIVNAHIYEVQRNPFDIVPEINASLYGKLINTCTLIDQLYVDSYKEIPEDQTVMPFAEGVESWLDDEHDKLIRGKNAPYSVRIIENTMRLSLIISISMGAKSITRKVAEWSLKYTIYWAYNIKNLSLLVNSSDYARVKQRFLSLLKRNKGTYKVGKMNKTILRNLRPNERKVLYEDLINEGIIDITDIPGLKGRPFKLIELCDND